MEQENLPKHIAIIMDGNRRWARNKGLPVSLGHKEGAKTLEKIVEMRYKPESKVLVFVTRKMIKEWCERQVPRKVLGDSHLKNLDNWLKKIGRYANIHL